MSTSKVETIGAFLVLADAEQQVIFADEAFLRLSKLGPAALKNMTLDDLFDFPQPLDEQRFVAQSCDLLVGHPGKELEIWTTPLEGEQARWLLLGTEGVADEPTIASSTLNRTHSHIVDHCPDALLVIADSIVRFANPAAVLTFCVEAESSLVGRKVVDLVHANDSALIEEILQGDASLPTLSPIELRWLCNDQSTLDLSLMAAPINYNSRPAALFVLRDNSQSSRSARALWQLSRLQGVRCACNRALVKHHFESQYLQESCHQLARYGGFRYAQIGLVFEDEERKLKIAAQGGDPQLFVKDLPTSNRDLDGLANSAIRCGQPVICTTTHNSSSHTCRKALSSRGIAAAASFPLVDSDRILGSLTLCSDREETFSEPYIELLQDIAADIAGGIQHLRTTRELILQARNQLAELTKLRAILNHLPHVVLGLNASHEVIWANQMLERLGYAEEEVLGWSLASLLPSSFILPEPGREVRTRVRLAEHTLRPTDFQLQELHEGAPPLAYLALFHLVEGADKVNT